MPIYKLSDDELVLIRHRWLDLHSAPSIDNGLTDIRSLLIEIERLRAEVAKLEECVEWRRDRLEMEEALNAED